MAAVSTPSMPFSSNEADLANTVFLTTTSESMPQKSPTLSEQSSPRAPLPLPNFVFPSKAPSPTASSSAPSSFSRSTGRRPLSAFELRGDNPATFDSNMKESLPDFSFGMQSPPQSPSSPQPRDIPTRSLHKRGTSEFIGGDGKTGAGALLSTSPTKGESSLPLPPTSRRGHAHRRSAAISSHDLSMILKPSPGIPRAGSAPTSPSGTYGNEVPFADPLDIIIQPTKIEALPTTNARLRFDENVTIIPRPLSLVSSDSSSTVRPGHSVSNSMSSIVSAGTSSPPSKEGRIAASHRIIDTRPKTAGPILDRDGSMTPEPAPKRRGSLPLLAEAAAATTSTPNTPRSAKKWSFFGHETASGECSPKSRPTSSASFKDKKAEIAPSPADALTPDILIQSTEPSNSRRSSVSRKPSKKQKKVRSWAGSILSRKTRQRSQKQKLSRRSPTPPLRSYGPMDQPTSIDLTIAERPTPPKTELQTNFSTWKPRKLPPQEESMSPIIDLDAALGPFNTPSSFGNDWDASQRGGNKKRAMHSAAGLGGFTGLGMHYHRRAESAPEFENPRFGLHRLGSSSTMGMEDVFEEDEDEEWEDTKGTSDKESSNRGADTEDEYENGLGIDIKVVDSDGMESETSMDFEDGAFQRGVKRKGSGLSEGERRNMSSRKSERSATSVIDEPIEEESHSPIEIVDEALTSRPGSRAQSSESTATPPFRPRPAKDLAPVEIQPFSLQPFYLTPTSPRSTTQSSFPSPRSPLSYDTQRISTAPSSITDESGFQSLLMGEPGPELRMSVDDVPSLTSSNSTTTRESGVQPGVNTPQFRDGQRSASLSSAAITRKRSSMASLSRLISSSHGERSKLSIESRPSTGTTNDGEKKEKDSKTKRFSRLVQFWKPKES